MWKMKIRRVLISIFISTFFLRVSAQKEDYIWFFGIGVFLDFNSAPPTVRTDGVLFPFEASSSLCDADGKLLMYSDGNDLYNCNKERMTGWQLQGGDWSFTPEIAQGALLLSINDTLIELFSLVYDTVNSYSLFYSKINPKLDSGKGEVISLPTFLAKGLAEKQTAIRHANGKEWWVIAHGAGNNEFFKFLIDSSGSIILSTENVGHKHTGFEGVMSVLIPDPGGEILASPYRMGAVEVYKFDRCTGLLTVKDSVVRNGPTDALYGISFSQNSHLLYISDDWSGAASNLLQYCLDSVNLQSTEKLIWSENYIPGVFEAFGQHRLGPDGKIYLIQYGANTNPEEFLGLMDQPNLLDTLCEFIPYSFPLTPSYSRLGLPNIPNYRLGPIYKQGADAGPDRYLCTNESVTLGVPDTSGGRCLFWWSPAWGLDDPTLAQPTYTNLGIDTFFVLTVTDTSVQSQCNSTTDTVWVFHELPFTISPSPDAEICEDKSVIIGIQAQTGFTYLWDPKDGLADPAAATTMAAPGLPMQYVLTITDSAMKSSCRSVTDTVNVDIAPCYLPGVIAPGDPGFMQNLEITGILTGTHLAVYDVTGRLVYRSFDYQNDWPNDDSFAAAGLYVYVVEFAEDPFGPLEKREIRKLLVRN